MNRLRGLVLAFAMLGSPTSISANYGSADTQHFTLVNIHEALSPFFICFEPKAKLDPIMKMKLGKKFDRDDIDPKPFTMCSELFKEARKTATHETGFDITSEFNDYFLHRLYGYYLSRGIKNEATYSQIAKFGNCVSNRILNREIPSEEQFETIREYLIADTNSCRDLSVISKEAPSNLSVEYHLKTLDAAERRFLEGNAKLLLKSLGLPTNSIVNSKNEK